MVAPAGTPAPIVDKLHGAIEEVLRSADTMKYLDQQGAAPLHMTSSEFGAYIASEMAKWGPVVARAGIKAE
jgi:tripartite-type tricarboxylate transporter receptor subunit TctC